MSFEKGIRYEGDDKYSEMEHDAMVETIAELERQRDRLTSVLEAALAQTGCDGDLCNYRWHEDARSAIAEAHGT